MKHEESRADQRRAAKARVWTEIGEAQITHTLFGKAKVRIILQRDKTRRASWLLAMLLTMLAAVAWLEWLAPQPTERTEIVDISLPVNATEQKSSVENMPLPAAPRVQKNSADTGQTAAIPIQSQPLQESQAQTVSPIAYNNATKNPAEETIPPTAISANQ